MYYHDHPTASYPGIFNTYLLVSQDYWWLDMKQFIKAYVQGCAICQSTKSCTTRPKIPTFPISTEQNNAPFEMIAMDLIVDLPKSNGFDSILTIMDHDCMKAAIFLPCNQTVDIPEVVERYAKHVFPHYGAPRKIISDRDP